MKRRTPSSTRTVTLFPYATPFRSCPSIRHHRHIAASRCKRTPSPHASNRPPPPPAQSRRRGRWPLHIRRTRQSASFLRAKTSGCSIRPTPYTYCLPNQDLGTPPPCPRSRLLRSEEHTSELQSLMRISYAVYCLKKKKTIHLSMLE